MAQKKEGSVAVTANTPLIFVIIPKEKGIVPKLTI
jgi:hypothetical protein